MKKLRLIPFFLLPFFTEAQAIISSWIINEDGKTASFWENTAAGGPPNYVYVPTTDSADVLKMCYTNDSVWINCHGMTNDMGQYLNPGTCEPQDYIYRFPRNPSVSTTKTISSKVGSIGLLLNGIPVYGLSNSYSWNGTANTNMGGAGVWNVEVYLSEGFVLDTAFAAHPQQAGAYHSHATPWRLFQSVPSTQHSPIVGFAFDGNPIYGPYGYSDPLNASSSITRMKTGYALRNITTRNLLPYGVTPTQTGPAVSTTYPLGTYCEDYEWSAANGGDLDKYNGRFCITPEYPSGTYAYFVTMDASGTPEFPYYIGIEYYGVPDAADLVATGGTATNLSMPTSGSSCQSGSLNENEMKFEIYPNPASDALTVLYTGNQSGDCKLEIVNAVGQTVAEQAVDGAVSNLNLNNDIKPGIYWIQLKQNQQVLHVQKLIIE